MKSLEEFERVLRYDVEQAEGDFDAGMTTGYGYVSSEDYDELLDAYRLLIEASPPSHPADTAASVQPPSSGPAA